MKTSFVTIKPGTRADGTLHRVPMPGGLGLPAGKPLPDAGARVPMTPFVRRLLLDKDAVLVTEEASPTGATGAPAPGATGATGNTGAAGGTGATGALPAGATADTKAAAAPANASTGSAA